MRLRSREGWVSNESHSHSRHAFPEGSCPAPTSSRSPGIGQQLLNATVLLLAVGMLGWHNVWMSRHGRELAASIRAVGDAVTSGSRRLYALAIVTGVAVLREGAETILFLYGITAGSGVAAASLLGLGLAAGSAWASRSISASYEFPRDGSSRLRAG
jgi:iron permease FTR1 family protein